MSKLIESKFGKMIKNVSPIISFGVGFFLVVGAVVFAEMAFALKGNLNQKNLQLRQELKSIEYLPAMEELRVEFDRSQAIRSQIDHSMWRGRTVGFIAAELQEFMHSSLGFAEASNIDIYVSPETRLYKGISVVSFELTARIKNPPNIPKVIGYISESERILVITALKIEHFQSNKNPSIFVISGLAPILLEGE